MSNGELNLLTLRDAGKLFPNGGLCEKTIRKLIQTGKLRSVRIGRLVFIDKPDLLAFVQACKGISNGLSA